MGSKTLYHQYPPVLNWRCWLADVDLYSGRWLLCCCSYSGWEPFGGKWHRFAGARYSSCHSAVSVKAWKDPVVFIMFILSVCDCFQCSDVIYFTSGTASGVKKIEYWYWHALCLELGHRGVTDLQMASLTQLSTKRRINHSANCAMACPPPRSGCIFALSLAYGIMLFACCELM